METQTVNLNYVPELAEIMEIYTATNINITKSLDPDNGERTYLLDVSQADGSKRFFQLEDGRLICSDKFEMEQGGQDEKY